MRAAFNPIRVWQPAGASELYLRSASLIIYRCVVGSRAHGPDYDQLPPSAPMESIGLRTIRLIGRPSGSKISPMNNQKVPRERNSFGVQNVPPWVWNVILWALALGAFAVAMVWSYREIHYNIPNDLRTPAILMVDALLAAVVAFGFAAREGSLKRWTDAHFCLRFGLWSAAAFRLLPPIINEHCLFVKNLETIDVQYVLLGACVHGRLTLLVACPYAVRVLYPPESRRLWAGEVSPYEMCGAVILTFYIVAGAARLLAWATG